MERVRLSAGVLRSLTFLMDFALYWFMFPVSICVATCAMWSGIGGAALFSDGPLRRYMVVPNEKEAGWTIDKTLSEVAQLNEWQAYSYSREQLIEKLDAAMGTEGE